MSNKRRMSLFSTKNAVWVIILPVYLFATNHYIRPDGTKYGTGAGTDWSNAFSGMPAGGLADPGKTYAGIWTSSDPHSRDSIGPGDTVFVGGGTYTTNWQPGASGKPGKPIVICRATSANHGIDTGWQPGFDALIYLLNVGILLYGISTGDCSATPCLQGWSYITIDGVVDYGIKIANNGSAMGNVFITPWGQFPKTGIAIRHIEMVGPGKYSHFCDADGVRAYGNGALTRDITIQHCYIHDFSSGNMICAQNILFEHNIVEHINDTLTQSQGSNCHTNGILMYNSSGIFRYNILIDIGAEGFSFADSCFPVYVYDNIFSQLGAAVTFQPINGEPPSMPPSVGYIYNNTFVNGTGIGHGIDVSQRTGQPAAHVTIYNNLFYNINIPVLEGPMVVHDYSWWSNCSNYPGHGMTVETNGVNGMTVNPFTDIASGNYHIKSGLTQSTSPKGKGKSDLGSPYNIDLDGNVRVETWDIGAYQNSSTQKGPSAPIQIKPTNGQSSLVPPVQFEWEPSIDTAGTAILYYLYCCENDSFTGCTPISVSLTTSNKSAKRLALLLLPLAFAGLSVSRKRTRNTISRLFLLAFFVFFQLACSKPVVASIENYLSYKIPNLTGGTTYYWKVRATDANGAVAESEVWNFTTK